MYQKSSHYSARKSQGKVFSSSRQRRSKRGPKKDYIDPSKFIRQARPSVVQAYQPTHYFDDFKLNPRVNTNLKNMGYKIPTAIQDQAIPPALIGKDVIGIANTGTGKTAAFAIPVIHRLLNDSRSKAVIIAPTRELAEQIEQACREIGKTSQLDSALLIGGMPIGLQLRDLRRNPRIIIGTPGRVKDHLERKSLRLNDCNMVVLDEVDRMLDMGFVKDISLILSHTDPRRQNLYFSATLDQRVQGIIEKFSNNPVHISVKSGDTSSNIEQNIISHRSDNKLDMLHAVLVKETTTKTIIFEDTQRGVESLSKELASRGFLADAIHGGRNQSQRQKVLHRFKRSEVKVLVATDVAARGLDVSDISHVINYSLPQTYDNYVHRIGRTGRAGRIGYALTFIENNKQ
ncbi:DEAD/DEAH box helicase [Candidatus Saccharibacteria bacterium]|nr:DEAD/DEAH box helicase [Candidatus Saccharibacteria bacterium]